MRAIANRSRIARATVGAAGLLAATVLLAFPLPRAFGVEENAAIDLQRDVLPIFRSHCLKCHGPNRPKGKLNLSGPGALARGGESGPVVVPGRPDESELWNQVAHGDMPPEPEEPLSDRDKKALRRWIERGAEGMPDAESIAGIPPGADHWAFAPPGHPRPPDVRDARRVRTPVDRFIQSALEARGLALGPDADRPTLIRRLVFDLTGLPPSLARGDRRFRQ
jgi:mono/diheme cytochrome c family protein